MRDRIRKILLKIRVKGGEEQEHRLPERVGDYETINEMGERT